MLYLVQSHVNPPGTMDPEEWKRLTQAESDYGIRARRTGKLIDIWRVAGKYAAVSVWDAMDHDELHALLSGLPLFPHADITVTALATHPSTMRWRSLQSGHGEGGSI
ncbi:MAG: muconolactone Delta-isomerase [Actinomycetota bacterium]